MKNKNKTGFDWDRSLSIGDLVFCLYKNKHNKIYKVLDVERCFVTKQDKDYYTHTYKDKAVGDELPPILTIQEVYDLTIDDDTPVKKRIKKSTYSAFWLLKVEESFLDQYVKKIFDIISEIKSNI